MIDASIPLRGQGVDLGQAFDAFDKTRMQGAQLQDMAQQRDVRAQQLQQEQIQTQGLQRENEEGQKIRHILGQFDVLDPEQQPKALDALRQNGLGHRVPEFASQFSASAAARQKLADDRKLASATLNEKMAAIDKATEENRKNYFATAAQHLMSLPPEQRQHAWDALIEKVQDHGWDHSDMPLEVYDDKGLRSLSRITMKPEDRAKLEKSEADLEQFSQLKPTLDAQKVTPANWSSFVSKIPPGILGVPEVKEYLDKRKPMQPNMAGVYTPRQQFQDMSDLRKDFENQPEMKALSIASNKANQVNSLWDDYQKAKKSGKANAQFSDQVFAVNFNKLIDETSAVMPGEFARTAEGAGLTDAISARIQQAVGGGLKFTDPQRAEMVRVANSLVNLTKERAKPKYEQYRTEAQNMSWDPSRITGAYDNYFKEKPQAKTEQSGPKVGTIEEGHRFKGGNPADPNNWERVK